MPRKELEVGHQNGFLAPFDHGSSLTLIYFEIWRSREGVMGGEGEEESEKGHKPDVIVTNN